MDVFVYVSFIHVAYVFGTGWENSYPAIQWLVVIEVLIGDFYGFTFGVDHVIDGTDIPALYMITTLLLWVICVINTYIVGVFFFNNFNRMFFTKCFGEQTPGACLCNVGENVSNSEGSHTVLFGYDLLNIVAIVMGVCVFLNWIVMLTETDLESPYGDDLTSKVTVYTVIFYDLLVLAAFVQVCCVYGNNWTNVWPLVHWVVAVEVILADLYCFIVAPYKFWNGTSDKLGSVNELGWVFAWLSLFFIAAVNSYACFGHIYNNFAHMTKKPCMGESTPAFCLCNTGSN